MLRSLEQERANYAWKCIQEVKNLNNEETEKKYRSYVRRASTLIQINGLGNTLAFYKSKKDEAYDLLYEHINKWFKKQFKSQDNILNWIISEKTSIIDVFRITKEIIALLNWMKRFAEAELRGEEIE